MASLARVMSLISNGDETEACVVTKAKVKYIHVQALRLCTGRTAHSGSRGMALSIHDHGTRRW